MSGAIFNKKLCKPVGTVSRSGGLEPPARPTIPLPPICARASPEPQDGKPLQCRLRSACRGEHPPLLWVYPSRIMSMSIACPSGVRAADGTCISAERCYQTPGAVVCGSHSLASLPALLSSSGNAGIPHTPQASSLYSPPYQTSPFTLNSSNNSSGVSSTSFSTLA